MTGSTESRIFCFGALLHRRFSNPSLSRRRPFSVLALLSLFGFVLTCSLLPRFARWDSVCSTTAPSGCSQSTHTQQAPPCEQKKEEPDRELLVRLSCWSHYKALPGSIWTAILESDWSIRGSQFPCPHPLFSAAVRLRLATYLPRTFLPGSSAISYELTTAIQGQAAVQRPTQIHSPSRLLSFYSFEASPRFLIEKI